mgnify:CR=1 FL=1
MSENDQFADACAREGITFVGPAGETLRLFGDKVSARNVAIEHGLPVVPGTKGPVANLGEAEAFVEEYGFPVIVKAAHGGGGRGMRVVTKPSEFADAFLSAQSEAKAAFGNGTCFIERYVKNPRHIEVQILGDAKGNIVHLFDRDCSVQRRHQKVVESAPALHLPEATREAILADAVKIAKAIRYENAGTVEFLVDEEGRHYFIEVNPRVQVEHTVTEEVTGVDIVQTQLLLASGATLPELGLTQDTIKTSGNAIQVRITTEDPQHNFQPDSGTISVYRSATGPGIRLDEAPGFAGAVITPHYDSLLTKLTARAPTWEKTAAKLRRALREFRIRGVTTNKYFLLNVLSHPDFLTKPVNTSFIPEHPEVLRVTQDAQNRGEKLLRFLAQVAVNGPDPTLGATGAPPSLVDPVIPRLPLPSSTRVARELPPVEGAPAGAGPADVTKPSKSFYQLYKQGGPDAFAKAVRSHKGLLITDTTWRDAHQSLLATRVRTRDLLAIAPATSEALANAFSIENWGGATFDVSMRFLRECPWDRLGRMREAVPDIPFQMLLRGANAVGYTSYPDNAVHEFCRLATQHGMDVYRVFDSLNYLPNLQLGIDAAGQSGGIVEAAMCYTGDCLSPVAADGKTPNPYNVEYYLDLARSLVSAGAHVLAIKDMAGLLKPAASHALVSALRKEFPAVPIHVHTHDTAGTGVASMLNAAYAGADAVDAAVDSMSGTTSQPSMGAIVHALAGTPLDTGIDPEHVAKLNDYWMELRGVYAPFESGQLTGDSSVYENQIPGGQYTNLLYQSKQLGLSGEWPKIKKAYAAANRLMGDIVKVTPSSKVVGDLAQFMVANGLSEQDVLDKADKLDFPKSVIEYFQGYLGIPASGFPEALRTAVLRGAEALPNGKMQFEGRPGAELAPLDFDSVRSKLEEKHGESLSETDVMSAVMYPAVFDEWKKWAAEFGNPAVVPTRHFISPMKVGEEIHFDLAKGKTLYIKLLSKNEPDEDGNVECQFVMNGEQRRVSVPYTGEAAGGGAARRVARPRVDAGNAGHAGAPMPGAVVDVRVAAGDVVEEGQVVVVLNAMKMETSVRAPKSGTVKAVHTSVGDTVSQGDLLVEIE